MARAAAMAGFWVICAVATPARATAQQHLPLELIWQAPAQCPSAGEVRAQLERIARVRPDFVLTPLSARAQIAHERGEYTLHLQTRHDGLDGDRELHAADCATLVRTLTLVLALAFGEGVEVADSTLPDAERTATPTETPAPTETPTPTEAPTDTEAPTATNTPKAAALGASSARGTLATAPRWALLVGGGAQFGLLPSAAFAASAGAELSTRALSLELRATGWPGVTAPVVPGLRAHFNGVVGAAQGCARMPLSALTLALCAGARAAALHGRSEGASDDGATTAPWYALSAATSLTFPRDRAFSVRIEAALAASLNRPRFVIDELDQVHRVPSLVPDVGAQLVIAL